MTKTRLFEDVYDFEENSVNYNNNEVDKELKPARVNNYKHILDLMYRFVIYSDKYTISNLMDLASKRQYINFIKEVYKATKVFNLLENSSNKVIDYTYKDLNLLKGCVFVVREITPIINELENKGYIVNQGIQGWRGQINSASSLLNCIDLDFRNSLYNHNYYHYIIGNIDKSMFLTKDKFNFNNIHKRLGTVRWYSTNR